MADEALLPFRINQSTNQPTNQPVIQPPPPLSDSLLPRSFTSAAFVFLSSAMCLIHGKMRRAKRQLRELLEHTNVKVMTSAARQQEYSRQPLTFSSADLVCLKRRGNQPTCFSCHTWSGQFKYKSCRCVLPPAMATFLLTQKTLAMPMCTYPLFFKFWKVLITFLKTQKSHHPPPPLPCCYGVFSLALLHFF